MTTKPDLTFDAGHPGATLYLLHPHTEAGENWIAEHIPEHAPRFGSGVAVEARYVDDIANGAMGDGLTVADGSAYGPAPSRTVRTRRHGHDGLFNRHCDQCIEDGS